MFLHSFLHINLSNLNGYSGKTQLKESYLTELIIYLTWWCITMRQVFKKPEAPPSANSNEK